MTIAEDDKPFFKYTKNHRFAPMYPLLAKEIVDKYGITEGVCLDIGAGSGALSIELSKITSLSLIALDVEPEAIEMAEENCVLHNVPHKRIRFVFGAVEKMPLPDASVNLILSRGSIPFWTDHVSAFEDIFRVLAPGGKAMIGCGFSRYQSREEVEEMRPVWTPEILEERTRWKKNGFLADTLRDAGITEYKITDDCYGTWVELFKSTETH